MLGNPHVLQRHVTLCNCLEPNFVSIRRIVLKFVQYTIWLKYLNLYCSSICFYYYYYDIFNTVSHCIWLDINYYLKNCLFLTIVLRTGEN
jgi:hypothetical protein